MDSWKAYIDAENERIREAKRFARRDRLELLTPAAASVLFNKSLDTIRRATRIGKVEIAFHLRVVSREIALIRLDSAVEYWGQSSGYAKQVEAMRENGLTLGVGRLVYNILHHEPLLELNEYSGLE